MAGYLLKYKNQYRVKSEYDLGTNDWVRDYNGEIDPDFDEMYIECEKGIKIKHGVGNELSCYIPTVARGCKRLRQIYVDNNLSPKIDTIKENNKKNYKIKNSLLKQGVLTFCDITDEEVYFGFKAKELPYYADLMKAKKALVGTTSPYAVKNLPKIPYKIPQVDIDAKKEITQVKRKDMKRINQIKKINNLFKEQIKESDLIDLNTKLMTFDQSVHSNGLWEEYLKFLKENIDNA